MVEFDLVGCESSNGLQLFQRADGIQFADHFGVDVSEADIVQCLLTEISVLADTAEPGRVASLEVS